MGETTTCLTERENTRADVGRIGRDWLEAMSWVVAVVAQGEAHHAQIVISTICASDQLFARDLCLIISQKGTRTDSLSRTADARVASTRGIKGSACVLFLTVEGRLFLPFLGRDGLCHTADQQPILNSPSNEPMPFSVTGHIGCNARRTEIKVAVIADAAVIMLIGDGFPTVVTVDAERAAQNILANTVVTGSMKGCLRGRIPLCRILLLRLCWWDQCVVCGVINRHHRWAFWNEGRHQRGCGALRLATFTLLFSRS
jgi:hypothetical protein